MRSGTTGDRITLHKAVAQPFVRCRRCDIQLETLAHILRQCTYMKGLVIRRHNSIRDFISTTTAQKDGYVITEEPSIVTPEGTLKPDLVVMHQKRVHVVDVTVRHEDVGYLQNGYNEKHRKYAPLLQVLADKHQLEPGKVLPIVVGTRGAIAKSTIASIEELGITDRRSLITIALLALRSSTEIYHAFLDYNRMGIG
jgi:hypothetical protein